MDAKNLHVIDHPLVTHMLTVARKTSTSSPKFRRLLKAIGGLLAYEATRDIKTRPQQIDTPLEVCQGRQIADLMTIVPILRAGLGMADGILDMLPDARVGHLGMFRDEENLVPISYYENLPSDVDQSLVLAVDPMLATGGSGSRALSLLKQRGCKSIRFICLVAAPEGVQRMQTDHPDVPIHTAALDRELNELGYILPGLGDAGDRLFGTV